MQGIIETLLGSEKNPAVIRIFCTFCETANYSPGTFLLILPLRIRTTRRAELLTPSVFPDHLQILPQLDPAAVWQEAAQIYAGVNHAIAADNRAGIDDRIATDLSSVADDCAEFP